MKKIIIISGSNRPKSNARRVSDFVQKKYLAQGVHAEVFDLKDYPFEDTLDGSYDSKKPTIKTVNDYLHDADGLVFVIPEYNGSFPGFLKVLVDYTPFPGGFEQTPVAYIGEASGAFGALRAVEQFQLVLNYRNALNFPERVFIQRVSNNFSDEEGPTDPATAKFLDEQITGFIKFVNKF